MGEGRRKLTPLSGELQEMVYGPAEPVSGRRREERQQKPLPTTRSGALLFGLRRFAILAGAAACVVACVGLLVVWLSDASAKDTFPRAFYFAGAFLLVVAAFSGWGMYHPSDRDSFRQGKAIGRSAVTASVAVVLVLIGAALDALL